MRTSLACGRRAGAVNRRYRRGAGLIGLLLALSAAMPAGALGATIAFVAPPGARVYPDASSVGPAGYTEAPTAVRTTDSRPLIGIQADGGTQLQCHFDNVQVA